jgi:large subunit ribosomal protein L18
MSKVMKKRALLTRRKKRVRRQIQGTPERPRLIVFRSVKHIYAQIIEDGSGRTLTSVSSVGKEIGEVLAGIKGKAAKANLVGKKLAEKAKDQGIRKVVFDRNGFLYHGRVKALAEGAREMGMDF